MILLFNVTDAIIEGVKIIATPQFSSEVFAMDGLELLSSRSVVIGNVNIVTSGRGFKIQFSQAVSINGTGIQTTSTGLTLFSSSHVTLNHSIVQFTSAQRRHGYAISINSCNDTAIADSVVAGFSDYAIDLLYSRNVLLSAITLSSGHPPNPINDSALSSNRELLNCGVLIFRSENATILRPFVQRFYC